MLKRIEKRNWLFLAAIFVLSYFTYFRNVGDPAGWYWDENYHITSAQKYLNRTFFMENHPPLGKLLMALGVKLFSSNMNDRLYVDTDYARGPQPDHFSIRPYRLMPAIFAWLLGPLIFFIFLKLTGRGLHAFFFSFLYVFDTAFIAHFRAAMLDGFLLFFAAATLLAFLFLWDPPETPRGQWGIAVVAGAAFGLTIATKVVGLVLILIVPALLLRHRQELGVMRRIVAGFGIGAVVAYATVWQTHFSVAKNRNMILPDLGYYQASARYKQQIDDKRADSLISFPLHLRDHWRFVAHYNKGVPRLNLCKADENGSPFFMWPFGARAINYRWETPDSQRYKYLYLQCNPVVWWLGLLGVIGSVLLLAGPVFYRVERRPRHWPLMVVFLSLYGGYMGVIARVDRVMYLYHYFLPLLFSFFLLALLVQNLERLGPWEISERAKTVGHTLMGVFILLSFWAYSPFCFYRPLTDEQFKKRMIFSWWDLHTIRSGRTNPLCFPLPTQYLPAPQAPVRPVYGPPRGPNVPAPGKNTTHP